MADHLSVEELRRAIGMAQHLLATRDPAYDCVRNDSFLAKALMTVVAGGGEVDFMAEKIAVGESIGAGTLVSTMDPDWWLSMSRPEAPQLVSVRIATNSAGCLGSDEPGGPYYRVTPVLRGS